jgi:hypothetical protein
LLIGIPFPELIPNAGMLDEMVGHLHALLKQHHLNDWLFTMIMMTKMDWKRRLVAKPTVNQKKILRIFDMRMIAHT